MLSLKHLVLDYNGTLAIDGIPIKKAIDILNTLPDMLTIHIVTADTHSNVRKHFTNPRFLISVLGEPKQSQQKRDYIMKLGAKNTVAIGNGFNDYLMLEKAAIGIAILQKEGLSCQSLIHADIVFSSITDALASLTNPKRLIASLRR